MHRDQLLLNNQTLLFNDKYLWRISLLFSLLLSIIIITLKPLFFIVVLGGIIILSLFFLRMDIKFPWRWPIVNFAGVAGADSHNFFITKGAELGAIGMILAFSLFIIYILLYLDAWKKSKGTQLGWIVKTSGAIIASFFVRGFFEGQGILTRGGLAHDIFFWVLIAFTIRTGQLAIESSKKKVALEYEEKNGRPY